MKWLRVKNLRSITDSGPVAIKPITLLVGRNGSGKSTFLQLMPLLRQSAESRTRGPLLWFGNYIDFGSFLNALRTNCDQREIVLEFSFDMLPDKRLIPVSDELAKIETVLLITLKSDTKDEKTYISDLVLTLNSDRIFIEIESSGIVSSLRINDTVFPPDTLGKLHASHTLIPNLMPVNRKSAIRSYRSGLFHQYYFFASVPLREEFFSLFNEKSRVLFSKRVSDKTIRKFLGTMRYAKENTFLKRLKQTRIGGKVFQDKVSHLDCLTSEVREIRNVHIGMLVPGFLMAWDQYMTGIINQINYIGPVRATAQRFYRTQELAVDRIDDKGQNLAEFLRSLTEGERARFKKWTEENLAFEVHARKRGEHIELKITEAGSKHDYNLADTGFGFSQVIPIAAQLWATIDRQKPRGWRAPILVSIEQPELHLHPSYQAKLADMMIAAVNEARRAKIDVRLIIETHSEAIVNRFGSLISAGKIGRDDVNVAIFEKMAPDEGTEVRVASFDEDGCLLNWPFGFFEPEEG